jgi:uncharacterized protein HemX
LARSEQIGENMQETKSKTNSKSLIVTVLILAVAAAGLIFGFKVWREYSAEKARINQQLAILSQKQQEISDLETRLENSQKDMQILLDKPTEAQAQSQEMTQIKDAYFLARLAEDRLQYANDVQAAKQLLLLAQDHLSSINKPELVKVKAIIVADQVKLSSLNYPDVKETHEKLAILDELLTKLPLKPVPGAATTQPEKKDNSKKMNFDKEWQVSLDKMLEDLKAVVKVRKKTDADLDLSFINTEINQAQFKLLIEQIRWAIFYRDAAVFQRSVKNAQELLIQVYDANDEAVKKFAKTLNELASVEIHPNVPSIQNSVNALQVLIVR